MSVERPQDNSPIGLTVRDASRFDAPRRTPLTKDNLPGLLSLMVGGQPSDVMSGMWEQELQAVQAAFLDGRLDPKSLEFETELVKGWEYHSGRNFQFEVLPLIEALVGRADVAKRDALIHANNEKRLNEIDIARKILFPCCNRYGYMRIESDRASGQYCHICAFCGSRMPLSEVRFKWKGKDTILKLKTSEIK